MRPNYDKFPYIPVETDENHFHRGWSDIVQRLRARGNARNICVECYPGVFEEEISLQLQLCFPQAEFVHTAQYLKSSSEIDAMLAAELTDDPVFGYLTRLTLQDFFPAEVLRTQANSVRANQRIVIGTGAYLLAPHCDLLLYADLPRWEIQGRQRKNQIGNLGSNNIFASPAEKYKRAFFVDWRVADRLKAELLPKLDLLFDTTKPEDPKMISGDAFRRALRQTVTRPFRVQPFFDPGPWGGQWMRRVCQLPDGPPNYAWCFDCVPEENSLVFGFGTHRVEVPALNLVLQHPRELLGDAVHARFGTEFPIRFDFLDTMDGGNLSLQVHPLTEYIQQHFGMHYTQDESYYLLDAADDACVYLGFKQQVDSFAMQRELQAAQTGGPGFCTDRYVNRWPAAKHDHFLIPAGTIHCSGRNAMVLEISATPYIFTFKLWDWGRLGLDGRPRPIHLQHGLKNLQWDRTTEWVRESLINRTVEVSRGEGWREERTGLHQREFIETRRHWFHAPVRHHTQGGVNVLNLVQGSEITVSSPGGHFEPFPVHYAETFIVPAAVGEYVIQPAAGHGGEFATVKAFVRTGA